MGWLQLPLETMMKSIIENILFMIILFTLPTEAQVIRAYGLKAGTVVATQSFDYTINASLPTYNRWGFDVGGFVELFDMPYFSMLTEIHYVQKGYSASLKETTIAQPDGTGIYITIRTRLDYLSVPILARVRFETSEVTPYVYLGPRIDFLFGGNDNSLDYSSTDIGASFGGGIQFSVTSSPQFQIEARFSPSFTNAFENQNLTVKNKSVEILIGVIF